MQIKTIVSKIEFKEFGFCNVAVVYVAAAGMERIPRYGRVLGGEAAAVSNEMRPRECLWMIGVEGTARMPPI